MISRYKAKIGQEVEVAANGVTYKGILKSMSDTEIILRGLSRTWSIPAENVTRMGSPQKLAAPNAIEVVDLTETNDPDQ